METANPQIGVLVVDDETDVIELFRQRFRGELRRGDMILHFAHSGAEAMAMMMAGLRPEAVLILSDINMPDIDGFALLAQVKRQWPAMPVMMLTAYGDEDNRARAKALGATDFLTKPIDFVQLKATLGKIIAGARGRS